VGGPSDDFAPGAGAATTCLNESVVAGDASFP
jgi:hypothetical protein